MLLRPCCCDLLTLIQIPQCVLHLALPACHMLCGDRGGKSHLRVQVTGITVNPYWLTIKQNNQRVAGGVLQAVATLHRLNKLLSKYQINIQQVLQTTRS